MGRGPQERVGFYSEGVEYLQSTKEGSGSYLHFSQMIERNLDSEGQKACFPCFLPLAVNPMSLSICIMQIKPQTDFRRLLGFIEITFAWLY